MAVRIAMGLADTETARKTDARAAAGVCAVVRAEVRVGHDEEFAALLGDLAHRVRAEEPGCTSYFVTRMMGSPSHFAVHARFVDWDAFEGHADTEHLARAMQRLAPLLATPLSMEIFLEV